MMKGPYYLTDYEDSCRRFKLEIPERLNLGEILCDIHTKSPRKDKLAMIFQDEKGKITKFTYGQMAELSNKLGNALKGLGVVKGDPVAFLLPSSPEIYLLYLACFKIGAIALPISMLFGREGIEYRVQDSGAKILITLPETRDNLENIKNQAKIVMIGEAEEGEYDFYSLIDRSSPDLTLEETHSQDSILMIYTSGTTGPPKGVVHTPGSILHTIETEKYWTNIHEDDLHWNIGDPTWIGGIMSDLFCALPVGATFFKHRRSGAFDPEYTFQTIQDWKLTNIFAAPTAYRMMRKIESIRSKYDLSSLKACTSAGEPLNPEVVEWGRQELGLDILDGYGQTEGIMMVTNFPVMPIKPGSMGKPAPGVKLRLLDEEGNEVRLGEAGQIALHKDTLFLFKEYWKKPEATEKAYLGDWYLTGDMGVMDEDGYITFVGRADDVIISAGYRIGPFEVESAIIKHPCVAESAAVAWPDPEGIRGHVIKAYVVLREGYNPNKQIEQEIQNLVKKNLSRAEYPRIIEFIPELPKTRSGKIMRKELRKIAKTSG
jgi:acyl-coenzyme A synthetase/AMP-(fatty) acid ligase